MSYFNKFKENLGDIKIKYKNESNLMKIISVILFFNKDFMTHFTTTIGKTIYFPSEEFIKRNENTAVTIIAHEYIHTKDITNIFHKIAYLFPQILSLLSAIMWIFIGWWSLLFLLFLLPLPAPWRMYYELKGYIISLFMINEHMLYDGRSPEYREIKLKKAALYYNDQFKNSSYYFMWPFGVEKKLMKTVKLIISDDILYRNDDTFKKIRQAYRNSRK